MTIEQLQYVCAIVSTGSFSHAADVMHITQSALSKQIARLESELDLDLFDRSHRKVKLTRAGELFYKDAKAIVKQHSDMMQHLENYRQKEKKTIHIAMLPIVSQYDLAKKLQAFNKTHPDIHLHMHELEEKDLLESISHQSYDCYILRDIDQAWHDMECIRLYQDILVAVVSLQHPLANHTFLSLQELKQEKLLLSPHNTSMSRIALQAFAQHEIQPHIFHYGRLETIISMAIENSGIALVMKKSLTMFQQDHFRILPFQEAVSGDICFCYGRHHEKREMMELLLSYLKE